MNLTAETISKTQPQQFERRKNGALYVAEYELETLSQVTVSIWRNGDGRLYVDGCNEALYAEIIEVGGMLFGPIGLHEERITFKLLNDHVEQFIEWWERGKEEWN